MNRTYALLFMLGLALIQFQPSFASAEETSLQNLPPGIAAQAQPLLDAMMAQCPESHMTPEHMAMMMVDMQAMADQLPPGIFLKILRAMSQLEMADMMAVHRAVREGGLLQRPPGDILRFVQELRG